MGSKLNKRFNSRRLSMTFIFIIVLLVTTSIPSLAIISKGFIYLDSIFYPSGNISNSISINRDPSGEGDYIITFYSVKDDYGAIYWQYPKFNWDDSNGVDLSGAKKLEFMVKSRNGTEDVIFAVGYPDSKYCEYKTVSNIPNDDWIPIEIPLLSKDLSKVAGGFGCIIKREDNVNGCTIYLKGIRYIL